MMWITGRNPRRGELGVTFKRDKYVEYGGRFLVSVCGSVLIVTFHMPPKGETWYPGYWASFPDGVDGWMPLPAPVCKERP